MRKVTVKDVEVRPAQAAVVEKRYTLELTHDEAVGLMAILGHVAVSGHKNDTYQVYRALVNTAPLRYGQTPTVTDGSGKYVSLRFN